jgi:p-hydroxybenzoate 3-monooxygenase
MHDENKSEIVGGQDFQKGVTPVRRRSSPVPMRYGRMFLAGDAAHIVPPTGAKGAQSWRLPDVRVLARGLTEFFRTGSMARSDRYSDTACAACGRWCAIPGT